jgi:hypothetical protein
LLRPDVVQTLVARFDQLQAMLFRMIVALQNPDRPVASTPPPLSGSRS